MLRVYSPKSQDAAGYIHKRSDICPDIPNPAPRDLHNIIKFGRQLWRTTDHYIRSYTFFYHTQYHRGFVYIIISYRSEQSLYIPNI